MARRTTTRRGRRKPPRIVAEALALLQRSRRRLVVGAAATALLLLGGLAGYLIADHGRPAPEPPRKEAAQRPSRPAAPAAQPPAQTPPPAPQQAALPKPPPSVQPPESPPSAWPQPAWIRFAVPPPPLRDHRGLVVIVIDDMGLDRPRSARVTALPGPLTLAFLPYGRELEQQVAAARGRGHEIMLHMPMEPMGHADPGPEALRTSLDMSEIRRRLAESLDKLPTAVGLNNHMGSRFTAWRPGMEAVMAEVKARGLLFLDSRTSAQSVAAKVAAEQGVPNATRNVFLDDDTSSDNVWHQLGEVERVARKQGFAIAIGHPHDNTVSALAAWLPRLEEKGLTLVPLSTVVRLRQAN